MGRGTFWFFVVLLSLYRTSEASNENQVESEEVKNESCSLSLNDRVSKLEAKDSHQEEEISLLKTTVHQLRGQLASLEAAGEQSAIEKSKRPARLLPIKFLRYCRSVLLIREQT